jgi:hypothetical protein
MRKKKAHLFKEISVWRRVDDNTLLRYRCLQSVPDGGYFVKSSHFYREPITLDSEQIKQAEYYFLDGMFGDALLEMPKETFDTLEKAIAQHDKDFDDAFE